MGPEDDFEKLKESYLVNLNEQIKGLKGLILSLPQEAMDWNPSGDLTITKLVAHVHGSLYARFNGILTGTYKRDRPKEFEQKGIPKEGLIKLLDEIYSVAETAFKQLTPEMLYNASPPQNGRGEKLGIDRIIYSLSHISEHFGQAQIIRDVYREMHPS